MTDGGYYKEQLAAERLQQCYRLAPGRVRQYLRAEVDFATTQLGPDCVVLDLGCGYGRTLADFRGALTSRRRCRQLLCQRASWATTPRFDTKVRPRLWRRRAARFRLRHLRPGRLHPKLSAFGLDRRRLVKETLRLLGHGGLALFSTYTDEFWDDRLDWFERQSAAGLIGPIDRRRTHDGIIVCTDGFRAATVREGEFAALVADLEVQLECVEVDHSSVFYLVRP